MAVLDAWQANVASAFSHSGSSENRSITGIMTIYQTYGSRAESGECVNVTPV